MIHAERTCSAVEIAALVGAGEPGSFSREDLFEAWRRFLERMAARYPLALVLEDIQWADEGLLDFVEHVADWAQGPILLVALARPELFDPRPAWGGGKRNATSIYLEPLSPQESAEMLDDLLAGSLTPALTGAIAERSEGNPLYVEEIVRKLIDDGVLPTPSMRIESFASVDVTEEAESREWGGLSRLEQPDRRGSSERSDRPGSLGVRCAHRPDRWSRRHTGQLPRAGADPVQKRKGRTAMTVVAPSDPRRS